MRPIALFTLCIAASVAVGQTADLRWTWPTGAERRYRMEAQTDQYVSAGAAETRTVWFHRFTVNQRVESVDPEGVAQVRQTFERVEARVEGPEDRRGPATFDSNSAPSDPAKVDPRLAPFASLADKAITFRVDPSGRVLDVHGMPDAMSGAFTSIPDIESLESMAAAAPFAPSDDSMRRQLEAAFAIVPGRPVRVGESWSAPVLQPLPLVGAIRVDLTHTLASLRAGRATIRTEGKLSMGDGVPWLTLESSSIAGEATFDPEAGALTRSEVSQSTTWVLRMPDLETGAERETRQRIEQIGRTELLR